MEMILEYFGYLIACTGSTIAPGQCMDFWKWVIVACFIFAATMAIALVISWNRWKQAQLDKALADLRELYVNKTEIDQLKAPWGDVDPRTIERNLADPHGAIR